jgi:hypothetical protein
VAFRMDACRFYLGILALNTATLTLLIIPMLIYSSKLYYFILIPLLGLVSGPLIPGAIMVAKNLLSFFNTFILSLFIMSMAIGGIVFQEITAHILDHPYKSTNFVEKTLDYLSGDYKSAYIIPYLSLIACSLGLFTFIPIKFLYRKYGKLISNSNSIY